MNFNRLRRRWLAAGGWVPPQTYRSGLEKARAYYGALFTAIGFRPES